MPGISTSATAATGLGYPGNSCAGVSNPSTLDKPQGKLWWHGGSWWADVWTTRTGWQIHRLGVASKIWVSTAVVAGQEGDQGRQPGRGGRGRHVGTRQRAEALGGEPGTPGGLEAWMRWAAGTDPDPVQYLLAALEVLRVPERQPFFAAANLDRQ